MTNSSKEGPLALGFIGGSLTSAVGYAHFVASTMDRNFQVVAGCFSDMEQPNQETARAYGIAADRVYGTWKDLVLKEKGRLDALVILLPTPMHYEAVSACLKEGFPVICEKALAVSSGDVEALLELQHRLNGFLAVTYNYSGYPMVRELRQKIQTGQLGKILHFQAEMPQEGYIKTDAHGQAIVPQAWRLADRQVPMLHLDLATHLHQLIHYLTGEKPVEVIADQATYGCFPDVVDYATCLCRYSREIRGQIWFCKSALGHRNGLKLRIFGSKGSAEWFQASPEELIIANSVGGIQIFDRASGPEIAGDRRYNRFKGGHPAGFLEAFANLYHDIAEALRQFQKTGKCQSSEVFGADLSLQGLRFIEAMVKSIQGGVWQKLVLPDSEGGVVTKQGEEEEKAASVRETIIRLIEKKHKLPAGVNLETFNFVESGHIDSMGLIKFVVDLEKVFHVEITESDMERPDFKTFGGLVRIICGKAEP